MELNFMLNSRMVRLIEWEKYITLMGIDIQETSKTTKNMGREK